MPIYVNKHNGHTCMASVVATLGLKILPSHTGASVLRKGNFSTCDLFDVTCSVELLVSSFYMQMIHVP